MASIKSIQIEIILISRPFSTKKNERGRNSRYVKYKENEKRICRKISCLIFVKKRTHS